MQAEELVRRKAGKLRFIELARRAELDTRLCMGLNLHDENRPDGAVSHDHHHHHGHGHHGPVQAAPSESDSPLHDQHLFDGHEHSGLAAHTHDESVTSVGIHAEGALDEKRLNQWLSALLREQGADIFRMKGILNIAGQDQRFVFQGVHMLFDGRADRPWGREPRVNDLVFIGRRLDRAALESGFRACLQ